MQMVLAGTRFGGRHLHYPARISAAPLRETTLPGWQRRADVRGSTADLQEDFSTPPIYPQVEAGLRMRSDGTLLVMKTAKKIYESDDQGVVHVDVPVGRSGQRVEVLVVWTDAGEPSDFDGDEPGMADLIGLLKGVDLERPTQAEYEKRDPIA